MNGSENWLSGGSMTGRVPIIMASETAECGLACLAMVANAFGHDIDLPSMRRSFGLSGSGLTLRSMVSMARTLGLAARPLRLELGNLRKLVLPAILHWDLNHFVVLVAVSSRGVTIHDPARGKLRLGWPECSERFTGVALELERAGDFRVIEARAKVRLSSLWSQVSGLWVSGGKILLLSLSAQALVLAAPFQMQILVDSVIPTGDPGLLTIIVAVFLLISVLQIATDAFKAWTAQIIGSLATTQITGNVIRHILALPIAFFERRHVGDILSRLSSVAVIQETITGGVIVAILDGLFAVLALIVLLLYAPLLAVVVLSALAICVLLMLIAFPMIRGRADRRITARAIEQSYSVETFRAITTVKLMGREADREATWRNVFLRAVNAGLSAFRVELTFEVLQRLVMTIQGTIVVYIGISQVMAANGFTLGMLLVVLSFRQILSDRGMSLLMQANRFRLIGLHLERLADIVYADPEPLKQAAPLRFESLELRDIDFRYGSKDPFVLQALTFSVRSGDFVAITGKSGEGKSTLLKLLTGLTVPTAGEIRLNGMVAQPGELVSLRDIAGVVTQDDHLLAGSIAENIAFFDPDADQDRVIEAARFAGIHEEIERRPMRYESLVGDLGSALSAGQRQRLLLARAIYRRPQILFLDEGTANLDQTNEDDIVGRLSGLAMTRVVISHRPAMVDAADSVFDLSAGRLTRIR